MNEMMCGMDPLPSNSDLSQLRAFAMVADSLSFSRAAASLGVSASALSQTMRGLEERLGVRLLNRTTRSVSLTQAGELLHARVRPAVDEIGAALGDAQRRASRPAGTVRVHSFRYPATRFISPMLEDFAAAYPGITLDVTLDDEVKDIVAGGFDVAIRIGEVIDRDMIALRLSEDISQIAVAAPRYLTRHGSPRHPRELVAHRCIGWRWPGHERPYDWEFFGDGRWFEVTVQGPLIVSAKEFGLQAAIDGVGIAFALREMAAPAIADGRLVEVLQEWAAPFPGYFLCYPAQRLMAPAVRLFIDAVCEHARAAAPR
jgi:DNA-binding transcriptional LysR family regulator